MNNSVNFVRITDSDGNPVKFERYDCDNEKQPYCCPVCGGNGLVPNGFYRQVGGKWMSTSLEPEKCRSCNGTGIVWG